MLTALALAAPVNIGPAELVGEALEVAMAELLRALDREGALEEDGLGMAALLDGTTGTVGLGLSVSGQIVVDISSVTTVVEAGLGITGALVTGLEEAGVEGAGTLETITGVEETGTLETMTGEEEPGVGITEGLSVSGQMVVLISVVSTLVDSSTGTLDEGIGIGAGLLETAGVETGTLETMTGEELGVGIAEGLSVSGQNVVLISVVRTLVDSSTGALEEGIGITGLLETGEETGTLETITGEELGVGIAEGLSVSGQIVVLTSVVTTLVDSSGAGTGTLEDGIGEGLLETCTLDTITGTELEVGIAEGLSVSGQIVVLTSVVTTLVDSSGAGTLEDGIGAGLLEETGTLETMTEELGVGIAEGLSVSGQMVVEISVVITSVELGITGLLETTTGVDEEGTAEGLSVSGQMVVLISVVTTSVEVGVAEGDTAADSLSGQKVVVTSSVTTLIEESVAEARAARAKEAAKKCIIFSNECQKLDRKKE